MPDGQRAARRARRLGRVLFWAGLLGLVGSWFGTSWAAGVGDGGADEARGSGASAQRTAGEQLYDQHCMTCHGVDGAGTYRGPTLAGVGAASADFYLRSGRMPIDDPAEEVERGEPAFDEEQIRALVGVVAGFGEGPPIPQVDRPARRRRLR